jgi:hypothetical protein
MIWDKWLEQLAELGPDADEWRSIGGFISELAAIAARKSAEQDRSPGRLPSHATGSAESGWLKNIYSTADVEQEND